MRRFAYVDTSAYLVILLREKQATSVRKRIADYCLCSSTLLLLEAERNLVQLRREKLLSLKDFEQAWGRLAKDRDLFVLRDFGADLCLTGTFPAIRTPRSADLVHLRTAIWFVEQQEGLSRFVTEDGAQAAAASELGLPVS